VFAVETGGATHGTWGVAGCVEDGVGVVGGETLVEEMVGEGGMSFLQGLSEGLGFGRLWAGPAVGVEGIADEEDLDLVLANEASDGFEVGAESGAVESEERLCGEAEGVGDGETDSAVANVERERARVRHGVSVRRGEAEDRE
jgi:hypothetical protein